MKKRKNLVKVIGFAACLVCIFFVVQKRFKMSDYRVYQIMEGFYEEPEDSLDAVYIGSSNVYAYWQAPLAWHDFGYTVYSMSIPGLPMQATKYMIEECRKTQPDALYIINMNNFRRESFTVGYFHFATDWMRFSKNKIDMITDLAPICGVEGFFDQLEFYFPIIRYHSAWSEFETEDFDFSLNGLKAASTYSTFLNKSTDTSSRYRVSSERTEPEDAQRETMEDLLDYLEQEQVNAVFVMVPQAIQSEEVLGQWNALGDMITERGFEFVDIYSEADAIGIQFDTDLYNTLHSNVHGSIKYTYYFAQYLGENYGFTDKRNDPEYAGWDEAYEKYCDIISAYALDFEILHAERDYDLAAPELLACEEKNGNVTVTWNTSEGADSYLLYRKEKDTVMDETTAWTCVAELSKDICSYVDENMTGGRKYTYTVVPVRDEAGMRFYGKFDFKGLSVKIE